jgi:hypothetical protein
LQRFGNLGRAVHGQFYYFEFTRGGLFGNLLRRKAGFDYRVANEERDPFAQHAGSFQFVYQHIGQRHGVGVDPVNAQQAAQRPLDRYRSVVVRKFLDIGGDFTRGFPRVRHFIEIQSKFTFLHIVHFCNG